MYKRLHMAKEGHKSLEKAVKARNQHLRPQLLSKIEFAELFYSCMLSSCLIDFFCFIMSTFVGFETFFFKHSFPFFVFEMKKYLADLVLFFVFEMKRYLVDLDRFSKGFLMCSMFPKSRTDCEQPCFYLLKQHI